jgi:hypothetical protein
MLENNVFLGENARMLRHAPSTGPKPNQKSNVVNSSQSIDMVYQ